ncbi:hypothetical protein ECE50_004695 [Chitinophaga sp. Mgbs1]|uniref:Uncharacterized protein n=1 Tax=Chitinophaga solisilvae TaxID=1233460 RepID=A0A433WGK5_9BACT|nr:hypothetical protein [Chitinophaga solisilvae]
MILLISRRNHAITIFQENEQQVLATGRWERVRRAGKQLWLYSHNNRQELHIRRNPCKWFQWSWNITYTLTFSRDLHPQEFRISCVKYVPPHWEMTAGEHTWHYFAHNGHAKSIFRDDRQVAGIDKDAFYWFNQEMMYIALNHEEEPLLIAGLALLFNLESNDDAEMFSVDLGAYYGPGTKKYDKTWRPR